MGNYNSCNFLHPKIRSQKAVRVFLPTGETLHLRDPTTAAELMLEYSHSFLVNSRSLHMGRRFCPLAADEELELGHVYILFPMRRLGSVVTAADVAAFLMSASSAPKRISAGGSVRVLPDSGQTEAETEEKRLPEVVAERFPQAEEVRYRLSICRSRKPLLDTIIEEKILCSK